MRLGVSLAILAAAPAANADTFVEVAGGAMIPLADDVYDYKAHEGADLDARAGDAQAGATLAGRIGVVGRRAGALLWVDWTPMNDYDAGFGNAVYGRVDDARWHRLRVLVGP